jgi:hypothetical protein
LAPAPAPAPATALELPVFTDFMLKRIPIFHVYNEKKIDLIHMLDPIQYEFRFFQNNLADPELEPEPKLRYSGSGQKF